MVIAPPPPPPPDDADDTTGDPPPSYADRIRNRIVSTDQLRDLPPPQPLVDGWLNRDSLAMIYGPSGAGKTFVAMDLANAVSAREWWHANPVENGLVLYVIAEGSPGAALRVSAWERHYGTKSGVLWHPAPINVAEREWATALAEVVAELEPALVVIDTFARSIVGTDENSSRDIGIAVAHLDIIRGAARCCVLLVHHAGKDVTKGARGASALKAAMDVEIEVTGTEHRVMVRNTKQKDAAQSRTLHFKLEPVDGTDSVVLVQSAGSDTDEVPDAALDTLAALADIDVPEGVSTTTWRHASDVSERTFYRHRAALIGHGLVVNIGTEPRPRYRPADRTDP